MVFRRKVEMNNKKTSSWNLGVKGYIIVILAFFSCYVYFSTDIRFSERNP